MQRLCFAIDLRDDAELIARYRRWHSPTDIWPEVLKSLERDGIQSLEIYLSGNRLFMIMSVKEGFSLEAKAKADAANETVRAWEQLMSTFQQPLPWAKSGEKWIQMERIFSLVEATPAAVPEA